jgi:transposase
MALEITEELIARQPPEAQAIIRALLARLAELEARLNQTPRHSSVPPSSEHPHAKPKRDHQRSQRQGGGQPGHRKHERPLLPPEHCTDVQALKPTNCRRCGQGLVGADPEPLRHQVWELPVIRPEVIEYRRHRLLCPGCGESTCAALPTGVPARQSGPRLLACAGLLMAFFRQSKRRPALFLETLLQQPCCPALTIKMQTQVTAALRPA